MKRICCIFLCAGLLGLSLPVSAGRTSFDPGGEPFTPEEAARVEELLAQTHDTLPYNYHVVIVPTAGKDPEGLAYSLLAEAADADNSLLTLYIVDRTIGITVRGANIPPEEIGTKKLGGINEPYITNRGMPTAQRSILSLEQMIFYLYRDGDYPTTPLIDEIIADNQSFERYTPYIIGGLCAILLVEVILTYRKKEFKRPAKKTGPNPVQPESRDT